jgi:glycosyltransferase involved in cell wall biosynthesis
MKNILFLAPNKRSFVANRLPFAVSLAARSNVYVVLPKNDYIYESYENIRFVYVDFDRASLKLGKLYDFLRSLQKKFPTGSIDCIYSYGLYLNLINVIFKLQRRVDLSITLFTGMGYFFSYTGLKGFLNKLLFTPIVFFIVSVSNKILVQNSTDYRFIMKFTKSSKVLRTHGSGLDINYWRCICRNGDDVLKVIHVSRLLREKGIIEYAKLSSKFSKSDKIEFKHYGAFDSKLKGSISKGEIRKEIPNHNISFMGNKEEMKSIYCENDILFFPSWREGFSRAVAESMSCGVVPIVWDVPGCRDAISNNVDGLILPLNDLATAEKVLRKWLVDRQSLATLSNNAVSKAETFDVIGINNQILSFIYD